MNATAEKLSHAHELAVKAVERCETELADLEYELEQKRHELGALAEACEKIETEMQAIDEANGETR